MCWDKITQVFHFLTGLHRLRLLGVCHCSDQMQGRHLKILFLTCQSFYLTLDHLFYMAVLSLMKTCQSYQNNQTNSYQYNNVTQLWLFQKEDYIKKYS